MTVREAIAQLNTHDLDAEVCIEIAGDPVPVACIESIEKEGEDVVVISAD